MNIDQIHLRWATASFKECHNNAEQDVGFLLSTLRTAEEALKNIRNLASRDINDFAYMQLADEALKRLKGGCILMGDYISDNRKVAARFLSAFTHSSLPACEQFVDLIVESAKEEIRREEKEE